MKLKSLVLLILKTSFPLIPCVGSLLRLTALLSTGKEMIQKHNNLCLGEEFAVQHGVGLHLKYPEGIFKILLAKQTDQLAVVGLRVNRVSIWFSVETDRGGGMQ